jgi:hypothetical protein
MKKFFNKSCLHEWRSFGNRLEEEVYPVFPNRGPVVCTKCGKQRHASLWKEIEKRPISHYNGTWMQNFFQNVIVEVIKWDDEL